MKAEIFKSDSYQKILKHVIKFRYPELSFEEGLKREMEQKNCIIQDLVNEECIEIINCDTNSNNCYDRTTILVRNRYGYLLETRVINYLNKIIENKDQYIILGRPITICELCDILNAKTTYTFRKEDIKNDLDINSFGNIYMKLPQCLQRVSCKDYVLDLRVTTELNYYLHEQSQDVIDKIARLFD